jgi:hypothetical protein
MRSQLSWRKLIRLGAVLATLFALPAGSGGAVPGSQFHGIAFTKGCQSPTQIGGPYLCAYQVLNVADTAHDTLTFSSIVDTVHAFPTNVSLGNILPSLTLHAAGGAFCDNTPVNGTGTGNTFCTLPFGGSIMTDFFSQYSPDGDDWANLPGHTLTDTAVLGWGDTCVPSDGTDPSSNCTVSSPADSLEQNAQSQSLIEQLPSSTATEIHNDQHGVVTAVRAGSTVHDSVAVTGQPGSPIPSGDVTIDWFTNVDCSGQPAANSGNVSLDASGQADATGFPQGPLAAGMYAFKAHYLGDNTYLPSDGACEPLQVVDARIHIGPDDTNEVGQLHTFTVHLEKNLGSGWVDADGEHVDATLSDAHGSGWILQNGGGTCPPAAGGTTNGNGECTIIFTSPSPGQVTGSASSTLSVAGVPITVSTNGQGENGGPATKTFVDAYIEISPPTANDPVNDTHTFTATAWVNEGLGAGYELAPDGTAITFSYVGAHVGSITTTNPCTTAGGTGSCSVDTTSPNAGQDTMQASTTVAVGASTPGGPVSMTRTTGQQEGWHGNSGNAVKNWTDLTVVTEIHNSDHIVVTNVPPGTMVHDKVFVTKNPNTPAAVPDPTGTVTFFLYDNLACVAGEGDAVISGETVPLGQDGMAESSPITATANLSYRAVYNGDNNYAPRQGDCEPLNVVDARITITPSGTNEIGHEHTFTVLVEQNDGSGSWTPADDVEITSTTTFGTITGGTCGPDGFTDQNGECTVTVKSDTPGVATVNASGTVDVGGVQIDVATDGYGAHDISNQKTWVDANIQINPPTATNDVGSTHTLTAHVNVNTGTGGYVNAPDGTKIDLSIVSGPGGFVGSSSCTTSGGTGSCTAVITSSTAGTTVVRATTTVSVGGVSLTRTTGDGHVGDSADAQKTWIELVRDANISITPPTASNALGTNHTLTGHVNINTGGGFVSAPAGTTITFSIVSGPGAFVGPSSCQTVGTTGSCTAVISSTTTGTTVVKASTNVTVNGQSLHRETGDGLSGDSANAQKNWVDANIQITPPTATNPVGTNHTLTGHVNVNAGGGFTNAPAGTTITFSLTNAGGANAAFVGPSSCQTSGTTGSCTVVISSTATGTTTINAATDVVVNGVSLHRETNGTAGNSGSASKIWADSTVRTDILNASTGDVVTTVQAGTTVHDRVEVAKAAGTPASVPNPTGTVVFHRFASNDCTGTPTNQTVTLTSGTPSTAVSDDFAPTADISYQAEYLGDANYPAHTGACEPLAVTPIPHPAIAIVKNPKLQTLPVGGTATWQITVTNTGDVTLTDVHVTDPQAPNCNRTKAQIPALASMAPGASVTYTCTRPNVQAGFTNVATAIGTPPTGPDVTAKDSAVVKVQKLVPKPTPKPKPKPKPKVVSHKQPKATG